MTTQEIKDSIGKMQAALKSSATPENLKERLTSKIALLQADLDKLEEAEKIEIKAKKEEEKLPESAPAAVKAKARKKKTIAQKDVAKKSTVLKRKAKKDVSELAGLVKKVPHAQTGTSKQSALGHLRDASRKAEKPGKRRSASGHIYYEERANRSDVSIARRPYLESGGAIEPIFDKKVLPEIYYKEFKIPGDDEEKYTIFNYLNDRHYKYVAEQFFPKMTIEEHVAEAKKYEKEYNKDVAKWKKITSESSEKYSKNNLINFYLTGRIKEEFKELSDELFQYICALNLHLAAIPKEYKTGANKFDVGGDIEAYAKGGKTKRFSLGLVGEEKYSVVDGADLRLTFYVFEYDKDKYVPGRRLTGYPTDVQEKLFTSLDEAKQYVDKKANAKNRKLYFVWNDTDNIPVTREPISHDRAQLVIKNFPLRFKAQGYYKTSSGERIEPYSVKLSLRESNYYKINYFNKKGEPIATAEVDKLEEWPIWDAFKELGHKKEDGDYYESEEEQYYAKGGRVNKNATVKAVVEHGSAIIIVGNKRFPAFSVERSFSKKFGKNTYAGIGVLQEFHSIKEVKDYVLLHAEKYVPEHDIAARKTLDEFKKSYEEGGQIEDDTIYSHITFFNKDGEPVDSYDVEQGTDETAIWDLYAELGHEKQEGDYYEMEDEEYETVDDEIDNGAIGAGSLVRFPQEDETENFEVVGVCNYDPLSYDLKGVDSGKKRNNILPKMFTVLTKIEPQPQPSDTGTKLRPVKVTYSDGQVVETLVAAGLFDDAIKKFFAVGKSFNLGSATEDNVQQVVSVEIIGEDTIPVVEEGKIEEAVTPKTYWVNYKTKGSDVTSGYIEVTGVKSDEEAEQKAKQEFINTWYYGKGDGEKAVENMEFAVWKSFNDGGVITETVPKHFGTGENIKVFDYETKNFDICKFAAGLYTKIMNTEGLTIIQQQGIAASAKNLDSLFGLEKKVVAMDIADENTFKSAVSSLLFAQSLLVVSNHSHLLDFGGVHLLEIAKRIHSYATGGRLKSALNRDRKYQSAEKWETHYRRKGAPTHPHYLATGGALAKDAAKLAHTENSLVVVCSNVGNPDFGQYAPLGDPEVIPVSTLQEAVNQCMKYIEDYDLGGGNWTGGQVYDVDGNLVAAISYNGRVWHKDYDWNEKEQQEYTGADLTKKWYDAPAPAPAPEPEPVKKEEAIPGNFIVEKTGNNVKGFYSTWYVINGNPVVTFIYPASPRQPGYFEVGSGLLKGDKVVNGGRVWPDWVKGEDKALEIAKGLAESKHYKADKEAIAISLFKKYKELNGKKVTKKDEKSHKQQLLEIEREYLKEIGEPLPMSMLANGGMLEDGGKIITRNKRVLNNVKPGDRISYIRCGAVKEIITHDDDVTIIYCVGTSALIVPSDIISAQSRGKDPIVFQKVNEMESGGTVKLTESISLNKLVRDNVKPGDLIVFTAYGIVKYIASRQEGFERFALLLNDDIVSANDVVNVSKGPGRLPVVFKKVSQMEEGGVTDKKKKPASTPAASKTRKSQGKTSKGKKAKPVSALKSLVKKK